MISHYTSEQIVNAYKAYQDNKSLSYCSSQSGIPVNSVFYYIKRVEETMNGKEFSNQVSPQLRQAVAMLKQPAVKTVPDSAQKIESRKEVEKTLETAYLQFEDLIVSFILKRIESQIAGYKAEAAKVPGLEKQIIELKHKNDDLQVIVDKAKKSSLGQRIINGLSNIQL